MRVFVPLAVGLFLALGAATSKVIKIPATLETEPVLTPGDAADDVAVWIHPKDPELSIIIGTDKKNGVVLYDLHGKRLKFQNFGPINNIDIRNGVITATNRARNGLDIYRLNYEALELEKVSLHEFTATFPVYGICMSHDPKTNRLYSFITGKDGTVEQWQLTETSDGKVDAKPVRKFQMSSQTEGCVVDDGSQALYLSEEEVGLWKTSTDPLRKAKPTLIDSTQSGHLTADIEGVGIYKRKDGKKFIVLSSQGDDTYVVYEGQGDHRFLLKFKIVKSSQTDGVTHTDGLDIVSQPLGNLFPHGLLIVQDDNKISFEKGYQDFKFVSWELLMPYLP